MTGTTMGFLAEQAWWAEFEADPEGRLDDLLDGELVVESLAGIDPGQALVALFRPLAAAGDTRLDRLDEQLLAWFRARLGDSPEAIAAYGRNAYVIRAQEALGTVLRLPLVRSRRGLAEGFDEFTPWTEGVRSDGARDLRRDYWRLLARSQESRRLLGLWYELCEQAGRRYPESYLDLGLAGLRGLPWPETGPEPGDELLHGLARWARRLADRPADKARFLDQWHLIVAQYPRGPAYWPERLENLLPGYGKAPFVAWWREELGLAERAPTNNWEPSKADTDSFLKKIAKLSGEALRSEVDKYHDKHEAYVARTGDRFHLPMSLNRVGNAVLEKAPALALRLARTALEHEPNNEHCRALWAEALIGLVHRPLSRR
ncbi:MAG: hypothetical protein H7841_02035 [Magnetospirillum sp. WYHS-4]